MFDSRIHEPIAVFYGHGKRPRKLSEGHAHLEGFHNLVKYIVRLRRDGLIDDEVFGELIKRASAVFIEAELSEKIERVLEEKLSSEYLMDLLK
jgi:hypothetical protein